MNKNLLLYILLITSTIAYGQVPNCETVLTSGPEIPGKLYYFNDKNSENLPYLFIEWSKGSIMLENGKNIKDLYLLFNTFTNQLIYHNVNLNMPVSIDHRNIREFLITEPGSSTSRIFRLLEVRSFHFVDTTGFFAEMLSEGKCTLYALRLSDIKSNYPISQLKEQKYYYFHSSIYYYMDENGQFRHFVPSNRVFRNLTKSYKDEIRKYIGKEHLNVKNESDLIKAAKYINSLDKN
jgi:hypothetical protein